MEKLVTLATYYYPLQAYVISEKLKSFGIWSFVADEYIVNANWLYATAVGGVKVQIRETDVEEARKLIIPIRGIPEKPLPLYIRLFYFVWFINAAFGSGLGFTRF